MRTYSSVAFNKVSITGAFWGERLDTVLTRTIPSQFKQLQSHDILGSVKLPKPVPELTIPRNSHNFTCQIFWDSDVGKWIEAAAYALSHRYDETIGAQVEGIIDDLERAQADDGYLNCWYLQREPENRWTNLRDNHELYNAGHLLEGAVAYYQATGKERFLNIMERYMDLVASVFGTGKDQKRGYPGHSELELALLRAFQATGKQKFLDLASYFVDERGKQPHYFDMEREARGEAEEVFVQGTYEYSQAHLPVREQTKVVGHAVRAMYLYTAMADLAAEYSDDSLRSSCETLWRDVTERRMYITGGFGPSADNEGFTKDYDLPNDTAYAETCASVAMIFWAARMLNLELDGRYADMLELALFNNTLAGLSQDGESYFYDNKLTSDGSHHRWEWHTCPCCTMNVARLVASVAGYFYGVGPNELCVHLYGGAQATLSIGEGSVGIKETSEYPWDGRIRIELNPDTSREFTLSLRIPGWCNNATLSVNGSESLLNIERGYAKINRLWNAGDTIDLMLPMSPERQYAHPDVQHDAGRVAVRKGPLLYCFEEIDQEVAVNRVRLPTNAELESHFDKSLLGGINVIKAQGHVQEVASWGNSLYRRQAAPEHVTQLLAVPYYIWCNRGSNSMQVWVRE